MPYYYMHNLINALKMPYSFQYAVIVAISVLCSGCVVQSVNPLYSPDNKEVVFDQSLLGIWGEEEGKWSYTFTRPGRETDEFKEKVYVLICKDKRENIPAEFRARLVKLGDYLFLDVYFDEDLLEQYISNDVVEELYWFHLAPTHTFWNIRVEGDDLHIRELDTEWVWNNRDKLAIDAVYIEKESGGTRRIILTANTADLQKFILEYAEHPKAFKQLDPLHRMPAE